MHYNQLSGSIPVEIGHLTALKGLHLESNAFTGRIPLSLCSMSNLTKLNLGLSQLSGSIPAEIVNLVNIQELKLNNNNLTGEIPKNLSRLTFLKVLCLNDNKLEGTIPEELGTMTSLKKLHLNNNKLTGKLPLTFRTATALQSLKVEGNNLSGPLTIAELNKTSKEVKIAVSVGGVLLAILLYWMIPLVLPFAGGICLHNHVQFQYPTSQAAAAQKASLFSKALYRRDKHQQQSSDALNGEQEDVSCVIPSYCKSLYLNMAFPFTLHRTITLSEVEVTALFQSLYQCSGSDSDSGGGSSSSRRSSGSGSGGAATTQVGLHVITVTRDIAQSIADSLLASTQSPSCSSSLSLIYINALETVLPLPAKAILLEAIQAVEKVRPLKIFYNRNDIAAEKLVTLHIQGMGYILRYVVDARPFMSLRLALSDWLVGLFSHTNSKTTAEPGAGVTPPPPPAAVAVSPPSLFQRAIDLLECSLQFDLTNHPKCVSGRGGLPPSHARISEGRTASLESFLVSQCGLSVRLARQLYTELGVELVSDLTLLRPSDLEGTLHLPPIPRRKLQLCVCDEKLISLQEKEKSIEQRPLCHAGAELA